VIHNDRKLMFNVNCVCNGLYVCLCRIKLNLILCVKVDVQSELCIVMDMRTIPYSLCASIGQFDIKIIGPYPE
jgi:hypothetical protein